MKRLINPNDTRYLFLEGNPNEMKSLTRHLNKIPTYQLLPTFNGIPRPQVFLDRFPSGEKDIYYCSMGLWREIVLWGKDNGCEIEDIPESIKYTSFSMTKEELRERIKSWSLNITPRDYQIDAAWLILKYRLSLSELATRAGKTLIFYIVSRIAREELGVGNILMIVPSIHLVKQGVKDLQDYKEYFSCEQIWSEGEEVEMSDLTIGTFQSLVKRARKTPEFFNKFDMVCVDEAHKAPCESIKTILSIPRFKDLVLRFGFTGTLPKKGTIEWFACQAILGPKIQEIRPVELIEEGYLAEPRIRQHRIIYNPDSLQDITIRCGEYLLSSYAKEGGKNVLLPPEERAMTMVHKKVLPASLKMARERLGKKEYVEHIVRQCAASSKVLLLEQTIAMFSDNKIHLIEEILWSCTKNTIIFAHNTEYINYLVERLSNDFPDKSIYKITGSISLRKRQAILKALEESNNNILVASFGTSGTGLTFKNVDHGIFAQSFKADTITRQSLGRLMLRTPEKTTFDLYDLIDVFPSKRIYNQGVAKMKTYKEEKYEVELYKRPEYFQYIRSWKENN